MSSSMMICLLVAIVNLFIFSAKEKITEVSPLPDLTGQMVKIADKTPAFEETGLKVKLNGEMPGYQWIQHLSGEANLYILSLGDGRVPVVSNKEPEKGVYKVVPAEEWSSLDFTALENEYRISAGGVMLIYQKNQLSITLFIVAGLIFLTLILLLILRTAQLVKLQKENPQEFDSYARNIENRRW